MSREIISDAPQLKEFYPMVGLRNIGDFVKGKMIAQGITTNGNPVITLELIDLKGSTSKSVSRGVYAEVDVSVGDLITLIGTVKDLKDKLPKIPVGEVVTITFDSTRKVNKGTMKIFKVVLD
jgi:hypothetical protein